MRIFDPQVYSGKTNKNITKLCSVSSASFMLIADGRLFIAKGNNANRRSAYHAAISNSGATSMLAGLVNAYEIVFPNEVGGLIDANGTSGEAAYALFENGNLYTWGNNTRGNLGLGHTNMMPWPTLSATDVVEVYTDPSNEGGDKDYGRLMHKKTDGWIYGAGYNFHGELGLGDGNQRNAWVRLDWMGRDPKSVWNLGSYRGQTVVQQADGTILGCGYNGSGALGIGSNSTNILDPVELSAWVDGDLSFEIKKVMFQSVSPTVSSNPPNEYNMLIWSQNGTTSKIRGAGYNLYGTLGTGNTTNSNTPVPVLDLEEDIVTDFIVKGAAVGSAYALNSRGELWGWGYNSNGNLGDGTRTNRTRAFLLLDNVLEIASKYTTTEEWSWRRSSPIIRKSDGYYVTGRNYNLALGTGNTSEDQITDTWAKLKFPENVKIKFLGSTHSGGERETKIAIDEENNIYAWGGNGDDMLDLNAANHIPVPLRYSIPALRM